MIREPLFQFLFIGALIYGLYALVAGDREADDGRTVTVSAAEIQALTDQWTRLWQRPPTKEELAGVIRNHVRTRILFREAEAMGLDDGDIVIQRRLAQKVELLARGLVTPEEPTDEDLRAWYKANSERFRSTDLYTLTHIFFDPDKREETTLVDAEAALAELRTLEEMPASYAEYGDRFMLQDYYPERSELELQKLFGSGFVEQVLSLEAGVWHGPVLSGYGTHLVLINEVSRAPQPGYTDIREQAKEQWMAEQVEALSEKFIDSLISRYDIVVEETEVPLTRPAVATAP